MPIGLFEGSSHPADRCTSFEKPFANSEGFCAMLSDASALPCASLRKVGTRAKCSAVVGPAVVVGRKWRRKWLEGLIPRPEMVVRAKGRTPKIWPSSGLSRSPRCQASGGEESRTGRPRASWQVGKLQILAPNALKSPARQRFCVAPSVSPHAGPQAQHEGERERAGHAPLEDPREESCRRARSAAIPLRATARTKLTKGPRSPPWQRPGGRQTSGALANLPTRRNCSARNGTSTGAPPTLRAPFQSHPSSRPARR